MVWDTGTIGAPARAALAQPRMQQAFLERCALLEVLLLLYYSRPLTVEVWLELARAIRSSLVLQGSAAPPQQASSPLNDRRADHLVRFCTCSQPCIDNIRSGHLLGKTSHKSQSVAVANHNFHVEDIDIMQLDILVVFFKALISAGSKAAGLPWPHVNGCQHLQSCIWVQPMPSAAHNHSIQHTMAAKLETGSTACVPQASLLLLETLDLETLLQLVAANEALTADSHRFGSPADRERINMELRSWWDGPSEVQTPVLLAWAAFLALALLIPTGMPHPNTESAVIGPIPPATCTTNMPGTATCL